MLDINCEIVATANVSSQATDNLAKVFIHFICRELTIYPKFTVLRISDSMQLCSR